jgi:hypothetical protein
MLLNTTDALRTELAIQFRHERSGISLNHPVQIGNTQPGAPTALMQQLIAHDPANKGQTRDAE